MKLPIGMGVAALALVLTACGSDTSGNDSNKTGDRAGYSVDTSGDTGAATTTITGPDGQKIVQKTGTGVTVELPDGFTLYPNAKVLSNTTTQMDEASSVMLMLQSEASPDAIAQFYRQQAEKAGMQIRLDMTMESSRALTADRPADGTKMTLSASRDDGDETTSVMLSVMNEPGD